MLYGGVAWSELPISTQGQAVPNEDELDFEGVIKLLFDPELEIKLMEDVELEVNTQPEVELEINTNELQELECALTLDFELELDKEQSWSL